MSQHEPFVSVIVCTRNRPESVRQTIQSILDNDYPHFELIVVDQSGKDRSHKLTQEIEKLDPRIHYVPMNDRGLAKARNFGVSHSKGEILLMTDDDCLVPPDWISTACRIFNDHPEYAMILGSVYIQPSNRVSSHLIFHDTEFTLPLFKPVQWGVGPNRALKREVFAVTGGLDDFLGVGGRIPGNEDSDFTYRVLKAGFRVFHSSQLKVTHVPEQKSSYHDLMKKIKGYCLSNGARYIKYVRCGDFFALIRFCANLFSWYWDLLFIISRKHKFYPMPRVFFIPYLYFLITRWHIKGVFISFLYKVDRKTMRFLARS